MVNQFWMIADRSDLARVSTHTYLSQWVHTWRLNSEHIFNRRQYEFSAQAVPTVQRGNERASPCDGMVFCPCLGGVSWGTRKRLTIDFKLTRG